MPEHGKLPFQITGQFSHPLEEFCCFTSCSASWPISRVSSSARIYHCCPHPDALICREEGFCYGTDPIPFFFFFNFSRRWWSEEGNKRLGGGEPAMTTPHCPFLFLRKSPVLDVMLCPQLNLEAKVPMQWRACQTMIWTVLLLMRFPQVRAKAHWQQGENFSAAAHWVDSQRNWGLLPTVLSLLHISQMHILEVSMTYNTAFCDQIFWKAKIKGFLSICITWFLTHPSPNAFRVGENVLFYSVITCKDSKNLKNRSKILSSERAM